MIEERSITVLTKAKVVNSVQRRGVCHQWRAECTCGWACAWQDTKGAAVTFGLAHVEGNHGR